MMQDDAAARQDYLRDRELMAQLDARTEVPHLLVELRSLGYIEICGKDMGGIYGRLGQWLEETWGCEYMVDEEVKYPDPMAFADPEIDWEEGFKVRSCPLEEYNRLCDSSYHWTPNAPKCAFMPCCGKKTVTVFKSRGNHGENNMGKLTMQLINFMTNTCGWGLKLCNGSNLGFYGQIREQQVKFKAPHPLNLIAPHLMIELRQAGYVEVNGPDTDGIYGKLKEWLANSWKAKPTKADEDYCDLKFSCSAFKSRGREGENNVGMRTMELIDFMVQTCAWTMITCNGGNYGRYGDVREQQMVFRNDTHVQHGEHHIMIELRDVGYVEVNGLSSSPGIEPFIETYLKEHWGCTDYTPGALGGFFEKDKYCDKKLKTPQGLFYKAGLTNNIGKLTIELATAMASQGWMLALCNGGHTSSIKETANCWPDVRPGESMREIEGGIKREQQIKFTRARPGEKADEPLLMIELRSVPPDAPPVQGPPMAMVQDELQKKQMSLVINRSVRDWVASAKYSGIIEVNGPNTNGIYQKLSSFIETYMQGQALGPSAYCDCHFTSGSFRQKMSSHSEFWDGYYCGENNFGKFSMRLCDFMVDHLGEWDLIVCNGNAAERAWFFGSMTSMVAREQQLVFRHRSAGRAVFMSAAAPEAPLGRPPLEAPPYWKEQTREGTAPHEVVPVTEQEKEWLQELLDGTYVKKVTRDRRGGGLADRFVVVNAVRSEHPALWDAFAKKRAAVGETLADRSGSASLPVPKTTAASPGLAERCRLPDGSNPANEAWLMHGTNPTSAVAILRKNFKIDLAGASVGTMFGAGAYLAEASSKSDEYAASDTDGSYKGLYAIVLCRAVVGRPYHVEKPGDYKENVLSGEYDCVLGDREKAVGTYREFILFNEDAIYPEIAVFYRREFSQQAVGPLFTPVTDEAVQEHEGGGEVVHPVAEATLVTSMPEPDEVQTAIPGRTEAEWQVVVPRGCRPGSHFSFRMPSGKEVRVIVPAYFHPGSLLTASV